MGPLAGAVLLPQGDVRTVLPDGRLDAGHGRGSRHVHRRRGQIVHHRTRRGRYGDLPLPRPLLLSLHLLLPSFTLSQDGREVARVGDGEKASASHEVAVVLLLVVGRLGGKVHGHQAVVLLNGNGILVVGGRCG